MILVGEIGALELSASRICCGGAGRCARVLVFCIKTTDAVRKRADMSLVCLGCVGFGGGCDGVLGNLLRDAPRLLVELLF